MNNLLFDYLFCLILTVIGAGGFICLFYFWIIAVIFWQNNFQKNPTIETLKNFMKTSNLHNKFQKFIFWKGLKILENKNLKIIYVPFFGTGILVSYFISDLIFYFSIGIFLLNIITIWCTKYDMKYLYDVIDE